MNKFTLSPHGEQHRLQHADANGNGTHIICTADELDQLRELLAPMAWQDKPSGAGKYVRMPLTHLPYTVSFVDVWDYHGVLLVEELGGLWLKLPDVPETGGGMNWEAKPITEIGMWALGSRRGMGGPEIHCWGKSGADEVVIAWYWSPNAEAFVIHVGNLKELIPFTHCKTLGDVAELYRMLTGKELEYSIAA